LRHTPGKRSVPRHHVGESRSENSVDQETDDVITAAVEQRRYRFVVDAPPAADDHVRFVAEQRLQQAHGLLGRIRVVAVDKYEIVCVDFLAHALQHLTFALTLLCEDGGPGM
jgi:hypothetical protein